MKIIAVIAQKGGTGKTTTAHAIGAGLILKGHRTLFIDLDAQGNLSYATGADTRKAGAYDLLMLQTDAAGAIQDIGPLRVIAAAPALAALDLTLTQPGKEYRLKDALKQLQGQYEYCVIDTPPALGIGTISALTASSAAIIPAQADIFSLQAIGSLYATISAIQQHTNPALTISGILLTRYNPRTILSRDITDMLEETAAALHTRVFAARIRECTAIKEAQAQKQDIFTYSPRSNAAADYTALIDELLEEGRPGA